MRFQPTRREAWLVDLDDQHARTEGDLCERHAAGLVLPRGWELHDERASHRDELAQPRRLQAVPEVELKLETDPELEPERNAAFDAAPASRLEGELAEVLDAQTPLLKRAFQNVWPLDPDDPNDPDEPEQ